MLFTFGTTRGKYFRLLFNFRNFTPPAVNEAELGVNVRVNTKFPTLN